MASAAVHAGVTLGLLLVHPAREVLVPGPDVVQVALVDAANAPAPAAVPKAAAPEPVPAQEESGVRIEPARRTHATPRPERAEPRPEPMPPTPAAASPAAAASVVLPYASVGGGLRGQVAVDQSNFEFAYYLQQLRSQIARNWSPTSGVPTGTRVEVYFHILRDGTLTEPRIEVSSGNPYFDQTATRAIVLTGHLPPLPLGYSGSDLGVHFGFETTGP